MSRSEAPADGAIETQVDEPQVAKREIPEAAKRALAEAAERRALRDAEERASPREVGGAAGPDPARYGDWEKDGIVSDF